MRNVWRSMVAGIALLAALVTHAQQDERRGMHGRRGGEERMLPMPRQDAAMPNRAPQGEGRHGDRMSPEERRQLRRDIDAAGRELYRPPPPSR